MAQGFQRRSCSKVWTDDRRRWRTDNRWQVITIAHPEPLVQVCSKHWQNKNKLCYTGLPLSGRTTYITPWDCHRTSKLNFKDVPRTSKISFVRPKSIPETSKNCQKARPLLTSCMMFAPPTYRKFATCVDWALRTSHFPLAGVLLTAVSSVAAPFWWLRDHCVYLSRVLSWLIDVFIIKFSTATPKIFVEIIWSHYYFLIFTS